MPSTPTGRVYFTRSLLSAKMPGRRSNLPKANVAEGMARRFEEAYGNAMDFVFNAPLSEALTFEYLGSETTPAPVAAYGSLGRIRCDHLLVVNRFHHLATLDTHFLLENGTYDLAAMTAAGNGALKDQHDELIRLMHDVYWGAPAIRDQLPSLAIMERAVTGSPAAEQSGRISSSYMYVSVCDQRSSVIRSWDEHAETLYGLLFMHREGVDQDVAVDYLKEHHWSSAEFFRNFSQPGGIVTISRGYPHKLYGRHLQYFRPELDTLPSRSTAAINAPEYEPYDLLPEYPPLRYLGHTMCVYAGWVEEVLRGVESQLFRIHDASPLLYPFRALRGSTRLQSEYYRTRYLDALRLPVAREYAQRLVDEKNLGPTSENIRELQLSALNLILLIIAAVSLLLGVVALIAH